MRGQSDPFLDDLEQEADISDSNHKGVNTGMSMSPEQLQAQLQEHMNPEALLRVGRSVVNRYGVDKTLLTAAATLGVAGITAMLMNQQRNNKSNSK